MRSPGGHGFAATDGPILVLHDTTEFTWKRSRSEAVGFPVVKQLKSFDFKAIPSLNKMLVLDLARGDYIERRENAILLGPTHPGS